MTDHPGLDRLDDYVDGTLDEEGRAAVEGHLAGCDACRAHVERSRRLMAELRSLPREIAPPRDLRPGASPGWGESPRKGDAARPHAGVAPGGRWWPAAAAVVVVLLGYALFSTLSQSAGEVPDTGALAPAVATTDVIEPRLRRYEETSRQLALAYRNRRPELPPAAATVVDAQLEVVDQAIARTAEASAARPDDPFLRDMLLSRYEAKVELLRRAVARGLE